MSVLRVAVVDDLHPSEEHRGAFLGSGLAGPLGAYRPDVVFHGHAHHGRPEGRSAPCPSTTSRGRSSTAISWCSSCAAARARRLDPILRRAVAEAREDRITTSAQALAYSLFLAIPASLLVLLGVFSLVTDEADVTRLVGELESMMPPEAAELLGESLERSTGSAPGGMLLTVIGLALAFWTTTSAATA